MVEWLFKNQVEEFKQAFELFDKESKGTIGISDLGEVLRALGHNVTDDTVKEMVSEVDIDGDGQIDFLEFITFIAKSLNGKDKDKAKAIFKELDKAGNGYLTIAKLRYAMQELGENLSDTEFDDIMAAKGKYKKVGEGKEYVLEEKEFIDILIGNLDDPKKETNTIQS